MKRNIMILICIVAIFFIAAAMISMAGDNNSANSGSAVIDNAPSDANYYGCGGPCGNYGFRGGGKGMFNGWRGKWSRWNCPGPFWQKEPQNPSIHGK
ncbi:MAG: hypothetical protein D6734_05615 [Candidatus Schekmanbacteria bacterium]|nr:MAG: hypothetical protein D6734_05615 [Candidatus Schekmanbacteria bacterium]